MDGYVVFHVNWDVVRSHLKSEVEFLQEYVERSRVFYKNALVLRRKLKKINVSNCKKVFGVLEQSGKIWKKVFKAVHKCPQVEQLNAVQCVHKCPQVEQLKAVQCVFQPVLKRSSLIRNETFTYVR